MIIEDRRVHCWYSKWLYRVPTLVVCASVFTPGSVFAYDPIRPLGQLPGLTELQQRTGDAIQGVCGGFIAAGGNDAIDASGDADIEQQRALFDKCGEMVHTGNEIRGPNPDDPAAANPVAKSLGLTTEQLGDALRNVAGEEIAAAGSLATESVSQQSDIVSRRLASVMSQVSTLQVSSASFMGADTILLTESSDRIGGGSAGDEYALGKPLGVYINGIGSTADKDQTDGEDGFETNSTGIALGVDYLFTAQLLGGLNLSYATSTTDFRASSSVAGGDLESEQANISAYGLWMGDRAYVDLVAGYGAGTFDIQRRIQVTSAADAPTENDGADDVVSASADSSSFRFSVGSGIELVRGAMTFAPYGRLSYLSVSMDGYDEEGDSALKLSVNAQDIKSLTSGLGIRIIGTYSGAKAIISPQFSAELIHEFDDEQRQIVSTYVHDPRNVPLVTVTDDPDRNYFTVGLGLSAVLLNGVQLYGDMRSLLNLDDLNEFAVSAGVRFEL